MKNKFIQLLIILISLTPLIISCNKNNPILPQPVDELKLSIVRLSFPCNSIQFINDSIGFIVGNNGTVYKTIDSGKTWINLSINSTVSFFDIFFFDENEGFVAGGKSSCDGNDCIPEGGIILHTTDGGLTWDTSFVKKGFYEIKSIRFYNDTLGYAVSGAYVLVTNNRGQSWMETEIDNIYGMRNIEFDEVGSVYIACFSGEILKSHDSGKSWNIVNYSSNRYYSMAFAGNKTLYVSGQNKIVKSIDDGNSLHILDNSPIDIYSIHFINEIQGFAFGRDGGSGAIYYTFNGGDTWYGVKTETAPFSFESVSFTSPNTGYALGGIYFVEFRLGEYDI